MQARNHVIEDKNPIRRILDLLDEVGASFLLVWLLAALVALFVLTLLS